MSKPAYSSHQVRVGMRLTEDAWDYVAQTAIHEAKVQLLMERVRRAVYKTEVEQASWNHVASCKQDVVDRMVEYQREYLKTEAELRLRTARALAGSTNNEAGAYLIDVAERVNALLNEMESPFDDIDTIDQLAEKRASKPTARKTSKTAAAAQ